MTKVWVDEKNWELAWIGHEQLGQGGQGVTRRVEHKETGTIGCVKLLSKQKDAERRLRFFREATAHDTCVHPLIPRLLAAHLDGDFSTSVRAHFLKGLRGLIEAPSRQVIFRGFFKRTPFATLDEALAEAKRSERRVFAVLFYENHPRLSKLDLALGYFMEYDATKALVDTHFVAAIVPLSANRGLVPTGVLELVRWFVLDGEGRILDQQDVYANPKEGWNAVATLTKKWAM